MQTQGAGGELAPATPRHRGRGQDGTNAGFRSVASLSLLPPSQCGPARNGAGCLNTLVPLRLHQKALAMVSSSPARLGIKAGEMLTGAGGWSYQQIVERLSPAVSKFAVRL